MDSSTWGSRLQLEVPWIDSKEGVKLKVKWATDVVLFGQQIWNEQY